MSDTTGSEIQEYNYTVKKANDNDLNVTLTGRGFTLTRKDNGGMLGKFFTVGEMYNYLCGYEVGLDRGLVDGINS